MNRKLFLCDEDYKRELYHRQSKLDPDYDRIRRRVIISTLIGLVVYGAYYLYVNFDTYLVNKFEPTFIASTCLLLYLVFVPFLMYMKGKQDCSTEMFIAEKENLEVGENDFIYRYCYMKDKSYENEQINGDKRIEFRINYDEVESVVYNSLHERVDVLCKYTERRYTSFSQREWNYEKKRTKMEQPVRIYLVFGREGNQMFLDRLRVCKNFEERNCREL